MTRFIRYCLIGAGCVFLFLMTVFSVRAQESDETEKEVRINETSISDRDREIIEKLELMEHLDLFMQEDVELLHALELLLNNS